SIRIIYNLIFKNLKLNLIFKFERKCTNINIIFMLIIILFLRKITFNLKFLLLNYNSYK
ncbi:unnamed protein product, partial [Heterotrigona itama]